jgi:hypothetical protein
VADKDELTGGGDRPTDEVDFSKVLNLGQQEEAMRTLATMSAACYKTLVKEGLPAAAALQLAQAMITQIMGQALKK